MNSNISGILSIKKSWFKQFKPLKFDIKDTADNKVLLSFCENIETKSKSDEAEKVIIQYLKEKKIKKFTRKEIGNKFNKFGINTIVTALQNLENKKFIVSCGKTNDKIYTVEGDF